MSEIINECLEEMRTGEICKVSIHPCQELQDHFKKFNTSELLAIDHQIELLSFTKVLKRQRCVLLRLDELQTRSAVLYSTICDIKLVGQKQLGIDIWWKMWLCTRAKSERDKILQSMFELKSVRLLRGLSIPRIIWTECEKLFTTFWVVKSNYQISTQEPLEFPIRVISRTDIAINLLV